MTAMLQLVPPVPAVSGGHGPDPRDPDVYRGGLASARAALRDGATRRFQRDHTVDADKVDGVDQADLDVAASDGAASPSRFSGFDE